ncbi:MAG: hypothetical protein HN833_00475 [Elusimicrobiaceae bacterium]|jgi:hypothetical protein|nr:hypothetical protein [Elusimicrobiaceae bacterium]MBT3955583.1 hypothetical protein [Elusimicrobiaceae bacterium]MBT4008654.1 hypothetical protein [Elusimicrobiaceae bacterium]MBT4402738.1 hypothetical protein [Elusimicrobiaceae bacterium]MBT4439627.1 hypothetical protein [Elusimicrobiaceae bacterium]
MKKTVLLITLISLVVGGYFLYNNKQQPRFHIAGQIEVSERLQKRAEVPNNTCSIVVKNEADVPVAIKRIINPSFPLAFEITEQDLLIDALGEDLKVEVYINNHGELGVLKAGDIFSEASEGYKANNKNVVLVADKMIGMPRLARGSRGNNFFKTAAR